MHQAYQDTLKQYTPVDHYRAHDNHVLHSVIQSYKFRLIITDMGKPAPRSVFNQTSLPPSERMEFQPTEAVAQGYLDWDQDYPGAIQ